MIDEKAKDLELISQVLLGKSELFAPLVTKYETKVRSFCRGMLRDEQLAEDAAQDIFIKAYQKLSSFKGDSKFSTWLFRIARNHCVDMIRARNLRIVENLDSPGAKEALLTQSSASSQADQAAARQILTQVLSELSDKEREVLLLRELERHSYDEIAEITGNSVNSVRGKLKRVRTKVLDISRHYSEEPDVSTVRSKQ